MDAPNEQQGALLMRHRLGPVATAFGLHAAVVLLGGWLGMDIVAHGPFWWYPSSGGWWVVQAASRWDSHWYESIAQAGYRLGAGVAFFPLYPMVVAAVGWVSRLSVIASGALASALCFCGALWLLHASCEAKYGRAVADRTAMLVGVLPMGAFFSAVYPSSLYLLTIAGTLWAISRQHYWAAFCAGLLGALDRTSGVLLATAALPGMWDAWSAQRLRGIARVLPALAGAPVGLAAYLVYLWVRFGSPFLVTRWERKFWGIHATFPGWAQVAAIVRWARGLPIVFPVLPGNSWYAFLVGDISTIAVAVGCAVMLLRREWLGAALFCALSLVLATSEAGFHGVAAPGRYMIVLFPAWAAIVARLRDDHWSLVFAISAALCVCSAVLFAGGYWLT
ncbi:MAG: hypothetical protein KGK07_07175 [Chloroflexota bacterium]|nr:hypothetical protein [Chloroflexota bacterium]